MTAPKMINTLAVTLFLFIFSTGVVAGTYVCYSEAREASGPAVRFKINPTKSETRHILGVTLASGERRVKRGDGRISPERIGLDFVERGWLTGYVLASSKKNSEILTGEAKMSEIMGGRTYPIRCAAFDSEHLLR